MAEEEASRDGPGKVATSLLCGTQYSGQDPGFLSLTPQMKARRGAASRP